MEEQSTGFDKLKYASTERVWEGIIIELTDASVIIDLKGRLGRLEIPNRMIISDYELKVGQEVAFLMSYPEVLDSESNQKYLGALNAYHKKMKEIKEKQRRDKNES